MTDYDWEMRERKFDHDMAMIDLEAENAELRDEINKLHAELTYLRLKSCPSCGIKVENEKLRELVADMWNDMCVCYDQRTNPSSRDLRFHADHMRDLGIEVIE